MHQRVAQQGHARPTHKPHRTASRTPVAPRSLTARVRATGNGNGNGNGSPNDTHLQDYHHPMSAEEVSEAEHPRTHSITQHLRCRRVHTHPSRPSAPFLPLQFRKLGYKMVDWVADYYKNLESLPRVKPDVKVSTPQHPRHAGLSFKEP